MADILTTHEAEIISRIIDRGESLQSVSMYLQETYPAATGLSARSVRRFCRRRGIRYRSNLNDIELDVIIRESVIRHGHAYGRRTMHGLLASRGIHVSQKRVGQSLRQNLPYSSLTESKNAKKEHESYAI